MKAIGSILSWSLVALVCMGASSCPVNIPKFPNPPLYVTDLANMVCAEYELVNDHDVLYRWVKDLPLVAKGPCDRMAGFATRGFKRVQNWARDVITAVDDHNGQKRLPKTFSLEELNDGLLDQGYLYDRDEAGSVFPNDDVRGAQAVQPRGDRVP